ncbi:MAG: ribonuclease Z [Clostridia bacterium]|nr:ribonuclease Z [Clostridia bacterium]
MLEVCLLGTGGMMPLPGRWLTALVLRYNGRMILVDCGEGTQIPLKTLGWGFKAIDAICFTHYHADHIAGLPGMLLTLGNSGREAPLTLMGPPELEKVIKGITVIAPELPFELNFEQLSGNHGESKKIDDIIIHSFPVNHTLPCLAYCIEIKRAGKFDLEKAKKHGVPMKLWSRLQKGEAMELEGRLFTPDMVLGEERKGLKVCYTTDTRPTEELAGFIENSDLFICEGMYSEDEKLQKAIDKKHMLFSEAAKLAKQGNVQELWLTHYSPALTEPEEHLHVASSIFSNTIAGKDLMTKTLSF